MDNSNKKEFSELMQGTGLMYNKEVTNPLLTVYFNALAGFSIDEVRHGLSKHALDPQQGSFFPKPADIARHIASVDAPAANVNDRAEMGWADMLQKMSSIGPYKNITSDDPQVLATVKSLGGWPRLCEVTDTELPWKKKEFIGNYKSLENTPLENIPKHMIGLCEESTNKKKGQKSLARLMAGFKPEDQNKLEDQS
jgi:hypothetical protein